METSIDMKISELIIENNGKQPNSFDIIEKLERHLLTDEVFVLLSGKAMLLLGEKAQAVNMDTGKIYNVKKGAWHAIKVTPDAKILIVENHNTGFENTQYMSIDSSIGANIVL